MDLIPDLQNELSGYLSAQEIIYQARFNVGEELTDALKGERIYMINADRELNIDHKTFLSSRENGEPLYETLIRSYTTMGKLVYGTEKYSSVTSFLNRSLKNKNEVYIAYILYTADNDDLYYNNFDELKKYKSLFYYTLIRLTKNKYPKVIQSPIIDLVFEIVGAESEKYKHLLVYLLQKTNKENVKYILIKAISLNRNNIIALINDTIGISELDTISYFESVEKYNIKTISQLIMFKKLLPKLYKFLISKTYFGNEIIDAKNDKLLRYIIADGYQIDYNSGKSIFGWLDIKTLQIVLKQKDISGFDDIDFFEKLRDDSILEILIKNGRLDILKLLYIENESIPIEFATIIHIVIKYNQLSILKWIYSMYPNTLDDYLTTSDLGIIKYILMKTDIYSYSISGFFEQLIRDNSVLNMQWFLNYIESENLVIPSANGLEYLIGSEIPYSMIEPYIINGNIEINDVLEQMYLYFDIKTLLYLLVKLPKKILDSIDLKNNVSMQHSPLVSHIISNPDVRKFVLIWEEYEERDFIPTIIISDFTKEGVAIKYRNYLEDKKLAYDLLHINKNSIDKMVELMGDPKYYANFDDFKIYKVEFYTD
jgi:hypothetical protein